MTKLTACLLAGIRGFPTFYNLLYFELLLNPFSKK